MTNKNFNIEMETEKEGRTGDGGSEEGQKVEGGDGRKGEGLKWKLVIKQE